MINAFSIDLEDWFCVYNFSNVIKQEDWDSYEYRAEKNTRKLLLILDEFNVKCTFFVLGWISEKSPELIKEIENRGHEIAFHTYTHSLINYLSREQFEEEITKGLNIFKDIGIKQPISGFRAPSFTITKDTYWALEILSKYNFRYDSSVFPVGFHPDYGINNAPLSPYEIKENLLEFPLSVLKIMGKNIPCCGGGYFRLYPYFLTKFMIKKVNRQGRPVNFYIHPWEIDPDQPKVNLPLLKKFRHYNNLNKTEKRLRKLLKDFKFTTIKNVLGL